MGEKQPAIPANLRLDNSPTNRLGPRFPYTASDMKRYEAALFDTIALDNHYTNLVSRFACVSNNFSIGHLGRLRSGL